MSFYLLNVKNPENDYATGKRVITAHFECDTVSDLPALVQSTYIARIGSTAHIIENNSLYAVKSNGVWVVQETGTDVYTKSQIDTMFATKQNVLTFDNYPTVNSDNPVKSSGISTFFTGVLQNTSKNQCPYNNLSAIAAGTILNDQPIFLPAGNYILTYDYTATTGASSFRFSYNGTSVLALTVNNTATPYPRAFTLDTDVNQIRLYTSVANDLTNIMIRNANITDDSYMPYVPTNRELYEMIQALQ